MIYFKLKMGISIYIFLIHIFIIVILLNTVIDLLKMLLMFKGNIIFKSFFDNINIVFGNDVKKDIVDKMKSAIIHYHL